ncbi:MAG TPA: T9SS type A sorting domain-containing protein, partial [Ignavibacteriaceae bacterium]|nr:T9SS type A sorting domain-containing protein [Ignavibacteriaceae bacterium]
HTTNGGINWVSQSAGPNTDFLYSVHFINSQVGMAVGLFTTAIRTTDGGSTWTNFYPVNRSLHFNCVFLIDSTNAFIAGYGDLLKTTNSGVSWTDEIIENPLTSIFFSDQLHGTAVGLNGTILHTDNGGVTEVNQEKINYMTYELKQNYPNPFNPSTTISFSLPQSQKVELKVFDILGNEVAVLLNEFKSAGEHKIEFDASNLSSGIYFCRLTAGALVQTKKMVLLQ